MPARPSRVRAGDDHKACGLALSYVPHVLPAAVLLCKHIPGPGVRPCEAVIAWPAPDCDVRYITFQRLRPA